MTRFTDKETKAERPVPWLRVMQLESGGFFESCKVRLVILILKIREQAQKGEGIPQRHAGNDQA